MRAAYFASSIPLTSKTTFNTDQPLGKTGLGEKVNKLVLNLVLKLILKLGLDGMDGVL